MFNLSHRAAVFHFFFCYSFIPCQLITHKNGETNPIFPKQSLVLSNHHSKTNHLSFLHLNPQKVASVITQTQSLFTVLQLCISFFTSHEHMHLHILFYFCELYWNSGKTSQGASLGKHTITLNNVIYARMKVYLFKFT